MEQQLQFPSFSVSLALFFFSFIVIKLFNTQRSKHESSPNSPPGPRKLPLIGNFHQLGTSDQLPHHRITDLAKKYGPVMNLQLGQISALVISSPEAAKEVMKEHGLEFAGRPSILAANIMSYGAKGLALAPYGDYWRQMRKICLMELLSSKRVQSFRSIREEEVSNFIRSISVRAGRTINLTEMISSLVLDVIARASVGTKSRNKEGFGDIVKKVIAAAAGLSVADVFPSFQVLSLASGMIWRVKRMHKEVDDMLEDIVNDRKASKVKAGKKEDDDLLGVLLNLQDHGNLEIPANTRVMINAWLIGRDPNYWAEADKFYPERFLNSSIDYKGTDFGYIPFGAGRRVCPAIHFATAVLELVLAQLLYHFDWELPSKMMPENLDMTEAFGAVIRRKNELILIPLLPSPLPGSLTAVYCFYIIFIKQSWC